MRSKGKVQVTIPVATRASHRRQPQGRGQRLVAAMLRAPRPKPGMTTDQLMALTRGE